MSGYEIAIAPCLVCGHMFAFNPDKVPSHRVDGKREPICSVCMETGNAERVRLGKPPHPIHPDAYFPTDPNEG